MKKKNRPICRWDEDKEGRVLVNNKGEFFARIGTKTKTVTVKGVKEKRRSRVYYTTENIEQAKIYGHDDFRLLYKHEVELIDAFKGDGWKTDYVDAYLIDAYKVARGRLQSDTYYTVVATRTWPRDLKTKQCFKTTKACWNSIVKFTEVRLKDAKNNVTRLQKELKRYKTNNGVKE